mgnify:FL=1
MGQIVLLDDATINKIAAGEVIERPASAVKEIMENSIDAGATNITVEIRNGGISYIRVTDNGKGIMPDDMTIAFERHATSKIRNADELEKVTTMGFRGEALASIAAIAKVTLTSKVPSEGTGREVLIEGGRILSDEEVGCSNGTSITIENLFYNTPVRYKFLKKDFTESGYIEDVVTRLALVHPEISIKLVNTGKTIIQTPGNGDIKSVIYNIYGKEIAENLVNVDYSYEDYRVVGVVGKPIISRANRAGQLFFVNNRYVKDKTLSSAAEQAFKNLITFGRHGFLILNISMDPSKVDVNVHPAKLEVRFQNDNEVFHAVYHAIKDSLEKSNSPIENKPLSIFEEKKEENNLFTNIPEIPSITNTVKLENDQELESQAKIHTNLEIKETKQVEDSIANFEKKNEEAFEDVMAKLRSMQDMIHMVQNKVNDEPKKEEIIPEVEENKQENTREISENTVQEEKIQDIQSKTETNEKKEEPQIEVTNKEEKKNLVTAESTKEEKISDNDFLKLYEKNFGIAVKKEESINSAISEFKPVEYENVSMFTENSEVVRKPVYKYIGLAFNQFITIEMNEDLYIINYKAIEEKIIYNKIKECLESKSPEERTSLMLLPDIITLDYKQMGVFKDNKEFLADVGLVAEEFGENTVKLSSVPEIIVEYDTKKLFIEILDEINKVARNNKKEIELKIVETIAKKTAEKSKVPEGEDKIKAVLDSFLVLPNPFINSNGETIAIKMTKYDIEKKFSRIQ